MKLSLFLFLISMCISAQNFTQEHVSKLKSKKDISFGDLLHANKGCLENSICSKANGKKILLWDQLDSNFQSIENFRVKHGLPIQFLTKKEIVKNIDPILFNSRCKNHNPKDTKERIYKGIKFLRNNPQSKKIVFTKVKIDETNLIFEIPYGDQPLYIKKNKLFFAKEFKDKFYTLSVTSTGKWKVEKTDSKLISKAINQKETIQCQSSFFKPNTYFSSSYCLNIWNEDTKELVKTHITWSCP